MELDDELLCSPNLEDAIDKCPLIVSPDTVLFDVIELMSQTRGTYCLLNSLDGISDNETIQGVRCSCVLVKSGDELLGIFTERDIVKLAAAGIPFENVTISEVMTHPIITLSETAFQDIFAALFLFRRYKIRHLVIVNEDNKLVGIVSPESIRQVLKPTNLLKLRRVSEVMTKNVIYAPPTATVLRLAQLMADKNVSCVVIVNEDTWENVLFVYQPVGIVTERDIVQFQALGLKLSDISAQIVMSTPLFILNPEDSLWTAHKEMQKRYVQRLVVSWDWGAQLAIVTQTNLLKIFDPLEMYGVVETLQKTIAQLEAEKASYTKNNKSNKSNSIDTDNILQPSSVEKLDFNRHEIDNDIDTLCSKIQNSIEYLIDNPDISKELQKVNLSSVVEDIKKIRGIVGQLPPDKI
jgi:CBS domain-containing protein